MADAWAEFDTFKKDKVDTGEVSSAQFFGTAADLKGNYLYRMAGAVLGIYGNTAAEAIYPNFSNDSAGAPLTGCEQLHVPLRAGPASAGQRVLVADHVRAAAEPAGGQPDQPIADQLADAAQPGAGHRRRLHVLHSERVAGQATRKPNWLPAPKGPFALVLRLYWPKPDALNGTWKAPKPEKA